MKYEKSVIWVTNNIQYYKEHGYDLLLPLLHQPQAGVKVLSPKKDAKHTKGTS